MRKAALLSVLAALSMILAHPAQAAKGGAELYSVCATCHQATGKGIPGAFPPLAGHAADLVKADRTYPVDVILYGLSGKIDVDGKTYNNVMPEQGSQLSDDEIAAVLNHVLSSWGNEKALPKGFRKFSADEVKARRGKNLTPAQVLARRKQLKLQ